MVSFIVINLSFFNPFLKVVKDFSFLDVYYAENFSDTKSVNPNIVLINIEHKDRFEIAMLLEEVMQQKPKVVGVDMIFKEEKEAFSDSLLASQLQNNTIVQAYILEKKESIYSHKKFQNNTKGFVNLNFDNQESVVREFVGMHELNSKEHVSWAAQITKLAVGDSTWNARNYKKHLKGNTAIIYKGKYDSFLTLGYDEFMSQVDKNIINNKIVLLGYIGDPTGDIYDVEDKFFTPLNPVTAGKSIPDMFGVVIHANIINMLLKNDFLYRISNFWVYLLAFICNFFLVRYFLILDKTDKLGARTKRKIIVFIFSVVIGGIALWLFRYGIILKVTPIIAFTVFSAGVVKYYKHLIKFIQTKTKWESYI
ncbi:MAG: CHASE2 domain-containing protein [Oceanihabitans sp.]